MSSQPSADYLIVGGGTSGLVVANRLSEDPDANVLVLEAGESLIEDPRVNVPAFWTTLLGSEADWQYHTIPQNGLNGRSTRVPQGKAVGGSSAINGQAFIAPSQADIDAWASMGNDGWDWASLAPYLKKCYTLHSPTDQGTAEHLGIDWIDDECRGINGPVQVSFTGAIDNPLCKAWIDAFRGLNMLTSGDPFSGNSIGGYSNAVTVDPETKTRSYAASAYGLPAMKRSNVTIIPACQVQKLLLVQSETGLKADGVEALVGGKVKTFIATKEVILAAGVYNTPKLLELSGIGDKGLLERLGIPVLLDLAGVGENLQDHLMTGVSYEVNDGIITGDALLRKEPEALKLAQEMFTEHQKGPFTVGGIQSHAFMDIPDADPVGLLNQYPAEDSEYFRVVRSIVERPDQASAAWYLFLAQANLHEGGKSFTGTRLLPENFISLGCSQSHPFSRGRTHIASSDAADVPCIDPGYFSHPLDLEILARHVQALESLRHTKELQPFFKPDGKRNHVDAYNVRDLDSAKKYVLDTATSTYHGCGTAAMLPKDKGGVVDSRLLVYGTKNLRIVDASIFPIIPRGNILSSVYAVAEKAADIIKSA